MLRRRAQRAVADDLRVQLELIAASRAPALAIDRCGGLRSAAMRKQKRGPEMFRMSRRASTKEAVDDAASEHERLASLTESMRAELAATREELRQSMTEVMANAPAPATAKVLSPKKKKQGSSSSFAAPAHSP